MDLPEGHVDALVGRLARGRAARRRERRRAGGRRAAGADGGPRPAAPRPGLAVRWSTRSRATRCGTWPPARAMRVQVRGAGRVGAVLAALLSGAGVGEVDVLDGGRVRAVGRGAGRAARRSPSATAGRRPPAGLVRRGGPGPPRPRGGPRHRPGRTSPGFSLVVVAPRDDVAVHAPDPAAAEPLIASGTPHLYAGVVEGTGVVGPLVLPGETGCAGCLHAGPDRPGPGLAAAGRPVALGQQRQCGARLRPGAGHDRRRAGGRPRARLPRRRTPVERGRPLGGLRCPPSTGDARAGPAASRHARAGRAEKGKGEHTSEDGRRARDNGGATAVGGAVP